MSIQSRLSLALIFAAIATSGVVTAGDPTGNPAADPSGAPATPVPDPEFSPEMGTGHSVRGHILLSAIRDRTATLAAVGQSAEQARREAQRMLACDWNLMFVPDRSGGVTPGSAYIDFGQNETADTRRPRPIKLPKEIVVVGMKILQANEIDSGAGPGTTGLPSDDELDLVCGNDWIVTWLEDEHGNAIPGTTELYCGGTTIPLD